MEKNTSPIKDIPPARELTIYTDGASRGNPGEAGAGAIIYGEVLHLFSDSELMVRQIKGIYKVRDRKMQALLKEIKKLLAKFMQYDIICIERRRNRVADKLANLAIDEQS